MESYGVKLVFCPACEDLVKLLGRRRACRCGRSWGRYIGDRRAKYGGLAVPLGISNGAFADAYRSRGPEAKPMFAAFFFPANAPTFRPERARRKR